MVVRRARLVPRIVLPWRVVICALGHDVSCSLALGNPVWGDGHYRPSCAPRPRLSSAHLSPSHGPGPPCPPPNPVGRGRILLLEILQITLSAEPFLAAVGVPRGGWCRADCASRVPVLAPGLESPLAHYEIRTHGSPSFGKHGRLPRTRAR